MATQIGTLTRTEAGFYGVLETLGFTARIRISTVPAESDRAPDYRVYSESGREFGAGWTRRSRKGAEFFSLKLRDPALGSQPIYPALVQSERDPENWTILL